MMILKYARVLMVMTMMLLLPAIAKATPPAWQIVSKNSALTFTAIQNNAPVAGQFKTFGGDIFFDPTQLETSRFHIIVDLGSVTTSYNDISDTLKTSDWLDVKQFPQAVYKTNSFTKAGNNIYHANGILTIRDKTLPVALAFVVENYTPTHFRMKGTAKLKRTAFGIGQGDFSKTDDVKDDVQVNFTVSAIRK